MNAVRESSQELMAWLVQTLLDEGVTAQTYDLDAMPFAAMEQLGHGLGKVLARQVQVALVKAQAARIREQHGDEDASALGPVVPCGAAAMHDAHA